MSSSIWEKASLRMLDPNTLLLDQNARTTVDIAAENPELVESVRQHGVLVPVIANPTEDGRIRVRDGHSRTMAARMAVDKHPAIPVLVTDSNDEEQWRRLRDQWITNEIRLSFSAGDKARLLEQMALFGLTAEQIAVELTTDVETVEAGLAVRRSARATDATARYPQLDMMQAAALTEFEADPEASSALDHVLEKEPEQYDHTVARLRRRRAERQALEVKVEALRASGTTVLDSSETDGAERLNNLRRSAKSKSTLSENTHAKCPGHAAVVTTTYTGEPSVRYVCQEWRSHGHVEAYPSSAGHGGPKTELEKSEMRRVRLNNEAWRAAKDERRRFLSAFVARKAPPKQLVLHVLLALLQGRPHVTSALAHGSGYASTLLGIKENRRCGQANPLVAKAKRASSSQILMLLAAVVLGGYESAYDSNNSVTTWRRPTDEDKLYFATLEDLGYTLSSVERLVLDPTADADQWPHLLNTSAEAPESDQPTADGLDTNKEGDDAVDAA